MNVYSRIIATGSYLPQKCLTNADLSEKVSTSDTWIRERTGIKQRYISNTFENTTYMALKACEQLLFTANISATEIDLIIVATCTPDNIFPSTACQLQNLLGGKNNILAFDVSAACNGFIVALDIADKYIKSGEIKTAIVIGSEVMSRVVNWKDRNTCILFGDGAGAILLQSSDEPGIIKSKFITDGSKENILQLPNRYSFINDSYITMQGPELFKIAVTTLTRVINSLFFNSEYNISAVDWLIPHQANFRIIKAVAEKINLSEEKIITTIAEHANTSGASIPLALDLMIKNKKIHLGDLLLLNAFGGGLSSGAVLVRY